MISRDCEGCTQIHLCQEKYIKVSIWETVECPDGTRHLVDS